MKFYPAQIAEKIESAASVGRMSGASAVGTGANLDCGAFVRIFLRIDPKTKRIVEARFQSSGCGYAIAAAAVLCERVENRQLNELHALDKVVLENEIERELGAFSADRAHCSEICFDALQAAFKNFRRTQIEEFNGEAALICTCFGVSERAIETLVERESIETVEAVIDACGAGGGCGSCQPLIQEIIDAQTIFG